MSSIETSRRRGALYVPAMKCSSSLRSLRSFARSALRQELGLLGCLLVLVACSPAPIPVSQSKNDPSSPSAPEGVTLSSSSAAVPSSMSGGAAGSPDDHAHHHHGSVAAGGMDASAATPPPAADAGSQGTVYVCPMHPEVTSKTAGVCPKCNMKLVPKK